MSKRLNDLDNLAKRYNSIAKEKDPTFEPISADDVIEISKRVVSEFVHNDKRKKAPMRVDAHTAHDIVMTFSDMLILSLVLLRMLKYERYDYNSIESALWDIAKEYPRMVRYIWDNIDAYFPTITYSAFKERMNTYEH